MHLQNIQDHRCCQYQIQLQDYEYTPLLALSEVVRFETPKDVAGKS
jgi:glutamate formiminotransferase